MLELLFQPNFLSFTSDVNKYFSAISQEFEALGGWTTLISILFKIVLACILGAVFGFEREIKNKPAGYVTFLLVSLGSCLFAVLQTTAVAPDATEKTRIIAQVVSGVGFLGAGTIMHNKGSVKGITTAALLWVSASIGLLVGTGGIINITTAIFATVIVYPLSLLTRKLGSKLVGERKVYRIFVIFEEEKEKDLYEIIASNGIVVNKTFFHNKSEVEGKNFKEVYIYMKISKKTSYQDLLDNLASYDWIKTIENA